MRLQRSKKSWSALRYLVWFTQVGFTVVTPPLLFCFGALWLKERFGWGNAVVIVGLLLGVATAGCGLRDFLKLAEREARKSEEAMDEGDRPRGDR